MNPAGLEPAACRCGGDRSDSTELRVQSEQLREKDSNLRRLVQSQTSCRLDDPEIMGEDFSERTRRGSNARPQAPQACALIRLSYGLTNVRRRQESNLQGS